jgi:Cu(I)/Ag(I) efflux system membrane protein CusA/SilA
MATLPGVNVEIGQPISHRIDAMLSGTKTNIAIKIFGTDLTHLFKLGNEIKTLITDIPGIADLNVEQQIERPQLTIIPRRDVLAKYGVPMPHFAEMVNVLLGGEAVCEVYDGNKAFDLTLKVADSDRATIESIGDMLVDAGGQRFRSRHLPRLNRRWDRIRLIAKM